MSRLLQLNDRVVPFFDEHEVKLSRVLTDRGTEYCGTSQAHEYELYLAVEDIDHTRTKARSPQTNGICERFHKTVLHEFYQVAFRKRIYGRIEQLQADLDVWITSYNELARTRAAGATARPRCRLWLTPSRSPGRKCSTLRLTCLVAAGGSGALPRQMSGGSLPQPLILGDKSSCIRQSEKLAVEERAGVWYFGFPVPPPRRRCPGACSWVHCF